ncbi:hypothetical protein XELAEV_18001335mg [Xenopus laevis]|nr:hypothetical protein XELAEV_18001335mg [Xenopus laevis]
MILPPAKLVRGMPLLGPFAENWENVEKFQARPDDLLICTYPKSAEWQGNAWNSCTTWMCEIVDQILAVDNSEGCKKAAIYERVPFLCSMQHSEPGPKGIPSSHQDPSVELLPKSFWDNKVPGEIVINAARNAKDVAVSYYYFYQMAILHPEPGTWDEFLDSYIEGKVCFGSWSTHVKGWWQIAKKWDVLYLLYEDTLEDAKREIRKVVKFMGKDLSEELLETIASRTSKAMKQNKMSNYTMVPSFVMDHSISPFMRKGVCGDWKIQFTVAQNEKFDEYYQRDDGL